MSEDNLPKTKQALNRLVGNMFLMGCLMSSCLWVMLFAGALIAILIMWNR